MRSCIEMRARALQEEEFATPTHARRICMYEAAVMEQARRLGLADVSPTSLKFELSGSLAVRAVLERRRETILEQIEEVRNDVPAGRTSGMHRAESNGRGSTNGTHRAETREWHPTDDRSERHGGDRQWAEADGADGRKPTVANGRNQKRHLQ